MRTYRAVGRIKQSHSETALGLTLSSRTSFSVEQARLLARIETLGALSGFVHLSPTKLIAVQAGRCEVGKIIRTAVHSSLLMLDGHV